MTQDLIAVQSKIIISENVRQPTILCKIKMGASKKEGDNIMVLIDKYDDLNNKFYS